MRCKISELIIKTNKRINIAVRINFTLLQRSKFPLQILHNIECQQNYKYCITNQKTNTVQSTESAFNLRLLKTAETL